MTIKGGLLVIKNMSTRFLAESSSGRKNKKLWTPFLSHNALEGLLQE